MPRVVPLDIEKIIVKRYWDSTASELAEEFDLNPNTIYSIWRRNGCTGKGFRKSIFKPNIEEFTKIYNSMTLADTAKYYHKDKDIVRSFAKEIGIYQLKEELLTPGQKQEILDQYYTKTAKELSEEYHVSASRIRQLWANNGLKGKVARTYHYNESFFENIDTEEKAYWLGFLAADGCVHKPKSGNRQFLICLTLEASDRPHLEKFNKALQTDKPIYKVNNRKDGKFKAVSIQFSSNKMAQDLEKYNVKPTKSYDCLFPNNLSDSLYPAYIRGYFDGDGSISKNFEINTLHNVNITIAGFKPNLEKFQKYLLKRGIESTFIQDKRTEKYKVDIPFGSLSFTNKIEKNKFLHFIYDNANIYLDRKYQLAQKFFKLCSENPVSWKIDK